MALSLPTEIKLQILRTAADVFINRNRRMVLDIALTSHVVYRIVAPVLHHTLVVNNNNWYAVQKILRDEGSASRVCPLVQHLIIDSEWQLQPERDVSMSFPYFTSLRRMTGHLSHDYVAAEMLYIHRWTNLTMLECWDMSTDDILTLLPHIPPTVTHFVHPAWIYCDNDIAQLDSWLANNGQHLTHFGFDVIAGVHEIEWSSTDLTNLACASRRVLNLCPQLQQLILHLVGRYQDAYDWTSYGTALANIDSRIVLLQDQRPAVCSWYAMKRGHPDLNMVTDDPSVYCTFAEARLGRTIWDLLPATSANEP